MPQARWPCCGGARTPPPRHSQDVHPAACRVSRNRQGGSAQALLARFQLVRSCSTMQAPPLAASKGRQLLQLIKHYSLAARSIRRKRASGPSPGTVAESAQSIELLSAGGNGVRAGGF